MNFHARIQVTCRPGVLDPQGKAVKEALERLGFAGVGETRVGKWIELDLAAARRADAEHTINDMCTRLLSHPVVEQYAFTLDEISGENEAR